MSPNTLHQQLLERINARKANIAVIGLGYVGLPLAVEFARAGFRVTGVEAGPARLAALKRGRSYIGDVASADLARLTMPAVVLTGQQDIPRPVAAGRQMATALGCPFVELPGAGHISSLETPGAVTDHLLSFLARVFPTVREPEEKLPEPEEPIAEIEE